MTQEKEYLTPKDISRILSIGMTKTYALINQHDFPKIRLAHTIRIPAKEFDLYMKKQIKF